MTTYLNALVGDGNISPYLAEDMTFAVIGSDLVSRGRAVAAGMLTWLYKQDFAARTVVKTTLLAGNRVAIEADFVGIHVGEFVGIPPTR